MKRYYFWLIFFACFLSVTGVLAAWNFCPGEDFFQKALEAAGARETRMEINYWGLLRDAPRSREEGTELLDNILSRLGAISSEKEKGYRDLVDGFMLEDKGFLDTGGSLEISLQCLSLGSRWEGYLLLQLGEDSPPFLPLQKGERLRDLLSSLVLKDSLSVTMQGEIEEPLSAEGISHKALLAMEVLEGKIIDKMKDGSLLSLTAYSPNISQYVIIEGEQANLNLALRRDSGGEITKIWLGVPIIDSVY